MTQRLSDPGLLNLLFPFHFILNESLGFVQTGSSLQKIMPEAKSFVESFLLVRPGLGIQYRFDSIVGYSDQVFILKIKNPAHDMLLKGQFIHLQEEQQLLFAGSPWITNEKTFEQTGLKIRDFAIHDSLVDLLQHVKVQQLAMEDVQEINNTLRRKNEELTRLYEQIQSSKMELENKNTELQKINSELDKFVYSISHDLRSPLLSIKGIIQMIPVKEKLSEGTLKFLSMANRSINRLDHTVQEILDYSRNARLELKLSEVNLVQTIEGVFADLAFASDSSVQCSLEINGATTIVTDKYRLETLLKNIIGNAVKYHNPELVNPSVKVKISNKKGTIMIRVMDNGLGISEKNLPKIFDMFYRANSSVTGTGLGLYICKEIINRLEGNIEVESTLGKGTTFTITFPNTTTA